ncbi:MAG: DUF4430 domain-containing protein [Firmicutes bacterium]|nr:DUF4430 domain-containing protein [Bacillota bacterium]
MNFLKKNKGKISVVLVVFVLLLAAYFAGGNSKIDDTEPVENGHISEIYTEETEEKTQAEEKKTEDTLPEEQKEDKPPQEPEKAESVEKAELFCTLCVRCDTILDDTSRFDEGKLDILPKNGVIFAEQKVEFSDGESVFDVLLREMKNNKIHLEFVNTPVYGSVYIEGIGNIYEFDAGELSGWMYRVNGEFPNFGCSKYILKQGDKVEFVYTCDLGKDVGGGYVKGQGAYDE